MIAGRWVRQIEGALWCVAVLSLAAVSAAVVHAHPARHSTLASSTASMDDVSMYDQTTLTRAADSVIANDAFRTERRPARIAFGMPPVTAGESTRPPRPQLTLGGIIGGPPWRAIVNGIPNHNGGTIVAPGDTLGGLRIRSIRRDVVVVQGQDTIWTLRDTH
jgi:hypothetical protein